MRILFSIFFLISLTSCLLPAQQENESIYKLPETPAEVEETQEEETCRQGFILTGTEIGLYKITGKKEKIPLWEEGKVSKILHTLEVDDNGNEKIIWYFLTTQGILASTDLTTFEYRNAGLPFLTIKEYENGEVLFREQPAQLKDLEVHPQNQNILVTATKDDVYLTRDGGKSWKSIGSTSSTTSGIKAVAVCNINREKTGSVAVINEDGSVTPAVPPESDLVVFMSHAIFGFSYCKPDDKKIKWVDCNGGFENMKTQSYPDEIADIMPVVFSGKDGFLETEVFVSQSYLPNLYRFNWSEKRGQKIFTGEEPLDTIDGLAWDGAKVVYTRPGEIAAFNPKTGEKDFVPPEYEEWKDLFGVLGKKDVLYSAWIPGSGNLRTGLNLCELWLLYPDDCNSSYAEKANGRKAIYVQAHKVMTQKGINEYRQIIRNNKLDAMVIDMKDDFGGIRFEPKDPLILEKGYISRYKIDLDTFVPQMKADGIYLIARIVSFKDKNLATYDKKQYAVWDRTTNKPWKGISGYEEVKDESGNVTGRKINYYDEDWVDPYSPEVWEYFVHIAQELVARGFDEIQFDYIRFPTDGKNMGNAYYRWKSEGMDKESALLSFLSYARKNIDAPIGIDIYGANGWYRSGTRTGQDVEQLAEYVDVICPMFYPSHFENSFLNYAPQSERPYRIYYYGTYRNTIIGRNNLIIRPWVQAFYLNVPYDRTYYNENYVRQQVYGVRDSVNRGYMYWNGMCRYDEISPDVGTEKYPGPSFEADSKFRKPALSGGTRIYSLPESEPEKSEENTESAESSQTETVSMSAGTALNIANVNSSVSAWDSVRELGHEQEKKGMFPKLGDIKKLWKPYSEI